LSGRTQAAQRLALKCRQRDGVLHDEPRRFGSLSTDLGLPGPAVLRHDPRNAIGVFVMHGPHARMVAVEERAIGLEL
jgi:hypothetical protein